MSETIIPTGSEDRATAHVIHPELRAVFAEHRAPQHIAKHEAHALLRPILESIARTQQQVAEYRRCLVIAETAPHNHVVDGKLEFVHQTLAALEARAAIVLPQFREFALAFTQLERVMLDAERDLTLHALNNPPSTEITGVADARAVS